MMIFFLSNYCIDLRLTDVGSRFMAFSLYKSDSRKDCSWNYYRDYSDYSCQIILMFMAILPSASLYLMDKMVDPAITSKAIGHQWYRTYESLHHSSDEQSLTFNSYIYDSTPP
uniref:Cytochrome oxidase subunit II copper A binding domain-containing protein n=1 Tax=Phlegmariurus squarrosus TaxID=73615 RepID=H9M843_PHLSQ|nr:hypothetical protein HusqMp42 [Phlegmariurus squarrosus]AEV55750.1 hypothetical protein HusqMp42 [Phlegmariurus squarrosus]